MEKQALNEEELVAQVRESLDASVQRQDAETRHKLIAAREKALAQSKRNSIFTSVWLKPAFATACAVFVAFFIINTQFPITQNQNVVQSNEIEIIETLAEQDNLELYEELEFYTWLAQEDAAT